MDLLCLFSNLKAFDISFSRFLLLLLFLCALAHDVSKLHIYGLKSREGKTHDILSLSFNSKQ